MNNINVPKELLRKKGIDYDSLPVLPPKKKISLRSIIGKITLLPLKSPIAQFALGLMAEKIIRVIFNTTLQRHLGVITPLCSKRLQENEEKIRVIAEKAGIKNPHKIKVLCLETGSPAAAIGKSTVIVSPEYLVHPNDLPKNLSFERLDNQEISEEEWVIEFNDWLKNNFFQNIFDKSKLSQIKIDSGIVYGKAFLKMFRNENEYEKGVEGVIGHELGHLKLKHTKRTALYNLLFGALEIPTLGCSNLIKRKVMKKIAKSHEIEADLYSQKKFGSEGLISFFNYFSEAGKALHNKYPEFYDEKGGNKKDHSHPHLCDRVHYLKMMDHADGTTSLRQLRKKIKKKYA